MNTRTNADWVKQLNSAGIEQEAALSDLRLILQKGLPYGLSKWLSWDDPQFEPLMEEVIQDTLLRVLERLNTFEGRSQFTTWVYKIAIRIALSELRRRRWRDVSLDEMMEDEQATPRPQLAADPIPNPEINVENEDMMGRVMRIIDEEMTEKQRQAMMAVGVRGMPMDEVARRMGVNRNALYKLLHDARLRLKTRLTKEGLTPQEILSSFDRM